MNANGETSRPNLLIFMTDQQNAMTIRDGQQRRAKTPHLDRFRQRAVTFNQAYAPSPHCCPSRASFFTGLYPSEHGVWNNVNVPNALTRSTRAGTPFWSLDYQAAGYTMGFSGKWHVSNAHRPRDVGWQELMMTSSVFGAGLSPEAELDKARALQMGDVDSSPAELPLKRDPGAILRPGWPTYQHYGTAENPFGDTDVTEAGIDFIKAQSVEQDAPWCLYVGTLGPHDPYTPPAEFLDWYDLADIELPPSFDDPMGDKPGLYTRTRDQFDQLTRDEHREALRHYLAFCSYEDALFGRVMEALEASGQAENTIVVFTSDHGDYAGEHGLWCKGLPAFQSAYHVPLVIGGPGIAPERTGSVYEDPISLVDLGPTLLDLCAVESGATMSGISAYPWLSGQEVTAAPRDVFFQSNGNEAYGIQRTIVSGRWKLVYNMFDHDELYDLENDPEEMTNLLPSSRGIRQVGCDPLHTVPVALHDRVAELYKRLWAFGLAHKDDNINGYVMTALAAYGPGVAVHGD